MRAPVKDLDGLINRLEACANRLESLETLPKPYDLYYAVKREGVAMGWGYYTAGIGVADIRAAVDALKGKRVA
jgi:hypothetical protein